MATPLDLAFGFDHGVVLRGVPQLIAKISIANCNAIFNCNPSLLPYMILLQYDQMQSNYIAVLYNTSQCEQCNLAQYDNFTLGRHFYFCLLR
jgi:hypothetical protein